MDIAKIQIKPLAGESDWQVWKYRIKFVLNSHTGALEVVQGTLVKPDNSAVGTDAASQTKYAKDMEVYQKANINAMVVLTNSMTEETLQKVMRFENARDVWIELHKLYEASSENQLYNICMQFFQFKWNDSEDIAAHLSKLKNLWNELNSGLKNKNEASLPELLLNCKILDILPDEFKTFKSSWLLLGEDKRTVDELTTQLCSYEREFKNCHEKTNSNDQEALIAKDKKGKYTYSNSKRKFTNCNYCHQRGHWVKSCSKWIADGRPPKHPDSRKAGTSCTVTTLGLMSVEEEVYTSETFSDGWYIDNGASRHITMDNKFFINFEKFESPYGIAVANGKVLPALGKGTLQIITIVNGKKQFKELQDVWYVPEISKNLFSVLATHDKYNNSHFESTATECWLKINNVCVLHGSRSKGRGLFKANMRVIPKVSNVVNLATSDESLLQLYHERWGHQDKNHVKSLMSDELNIKVNVENTLCEACIYGKAHRLSFGSRDNCSTAGELISADVCGPFDKSFRKSQYFVVFKDQFTKFRCVYFLKNKSDVASSLREFLAYSRNCGHKIKEIISDNGGEFDNKEIKDILRNMGIVQRLTAPYTPQQNGGSERENRTLVEMARTLKNSNPDLKIPPALWAELINTSAYILNRTGKSTIKNMSPYELWTGKKPRIKHLRIIGSMCYAHIPKQKRRKMDNKAVKAYLIGYDGNERYRLWIPESNTVILSRDVKFNEKLLNCEKTVEFPIADTGSENQGKSDDVLDEDEFRNKSEEENADLESSRESRKLRDRETLRKPKHYEDYIMMAEAFIADFEEPTTFEEAIECKQSKHWKNAMDLEMSSLIENETWILEELPKNSKAIPCKWVYKIKRNPDGSIDKYKARLVAKGFTQRYGIDYEQTFSPVTKMGTVRSILSIAANEGLHLIQFDVCSAFLYGTLDEVIYMKQPEGYSDGTAKVCKLKRSLYGLKQASRCWNRSFQQFLSELEFKPSDADPCLYIRNSNGKKLIVCLYVDDGLVASTDLQESEKFIEDLRSRFKITSKQASYFLGLEIHRLEDGSVKIEQQSYARRILEKFHMESSRPVSTPMVKEDINIQEDDEDNNEKFPYREAVGALMYLMICTRPDLAYCVSILSRNLENPSRVDWLKVKRVFRYLVGSYQKGIIYKNSYKQGILECYSDADFGGCRISGRSTSGTVILYSGGAVSWLSQRQSVVATSTTEAEIIAANECVREIIWLNRLFCGVTELNGIPVLQVDNTAAIRLAQNPEFHRRTKHISIKHFFIREKVLEKEIIVQQVSTEEQIADMFTKPLFKPRLLTLSAKIGLL